MENLAISLCDTVVPFVVLVFTSPKLHSRKGTVKIKGIEKLSTGRRNLLVTPLLTFSPLLSTLYLPLLSVGKMPEQ